MNGGARTASADDLPADVRAALDAWRAALPDAGADVGADDIVTVARAPGRLDVIGGIADYSGSEVLQRTTREAVVAIARRIAAPVLRIRSASANGADRHIALPMSLFAPGGACATPAAARAHFAARPADAWAAYVAGPLVMLVHGHGRAHGHEHERGLMPAAGYELLVRSDVPEGKGVSSSAALELASAAALARLEALPVADDGAALARLCQRAENDVVGAPCGLMDQMTSALGAADALFALHCVPDRVLAPVPLADGFALWGIDSGVRHAVSGADYGSVRTGAFIGYRLLLEAAGIAPPDVCARDVVDTRWQGYLANATPSELDDELGAALPARLTGAAFLARFDGITDTVTRVDPARDYAVRAPTRHPVLERQRVRAFRQLMPALAAATDERVRDDVATTMGECLYASHAGYGACGLGTPETDALVTAVRAAGPGAGLYGARVSGGGSGGTVAVFGRRDADAAVRRIAAAHRARPGVARNTSPATSPDGALDGAGGRVFAGSSDGLRTWTLGAVA